MHHMPWNRSPATTSASAENLAKIRKFSRELAVLVKHFNTTFGYYSLSVQVMGIVTVIVNMTFAVLFLSIRGLILAAAFCVVILGAYKNYGVLYEESKKSISQWSGYTATESQQRWFCRFTKSCMPLRINIGAFYYADRSLMLTMLSTILVSTANLALTIRG